LSSNYLLKLLYISGLFLLSIPLTAQVRSADVSVPQLVYKNWNNQNGLPQNTVSDIAIDASGFLWTTTEEGLVRFDGATFSVYNESNVTGLYSNNFTDISTNGTVLWAASRNSLLRVEGKRMAVIDFRKYLGNSWIKCVEADPTGRLWIGTSNGTLFYLERNAVFKWSGLKPLISIETIKAIGENIFVGTAKGLIEIQENSKHWVYPELIDKHITALASNGKGELWVGTAEDGLFVMDKGSVLLHLTEKEGLREPYINSLAIGEKGEAWIGTRSSGYQIYKAGSWMIPDQKEFFKDGIRSILIKDQYTTWVGTNSSGLVMAKQSKIHMLDVDKKLASSIILPIYQHSDGEVWIGTAGNGVNRLANNTVTNFNKENGLSNNLVLSVYGTPSHIYIGTANGLDRFDLRTSRIDRRFTKNDGLSNNSIVALLSDRQKRFWITTRSGGVHLLKENNRIQKQSLPDSLATTTFITIYEDRSGNIWFGSRGGGMLRLDTAGRFTQFNQKSGFNADIVYSFMEDAEGGLWMNTEKGLFCFYKDRFTLFDKAAGLRYNDNYRALLDNEGYVWLSCNYGLQRVSLASLQAMRDKGKKGEQLSVQLYNTVDGMTNAETNGGFSPAGWKMQNGQLWFPTVEGIAMVDPKLIYNEVNSLDIQLQQFKYGRHMLLPGKGISVPPGTNNIEIHYTSIDFAKASNIQYYYRLKGLSDEWKMVGNRRVVYFTGLSHGEYTFEVKAEQFGKWSEVASLDFTVKPYFYEARWFKMVLLALFLGIGVIVILYQRKKEKRKLLLAKEITKAQIMGQEKERQVIGVELHDNINQQLTTVKLYLDVAKTNDEARVNLIERSEKVLQSVIDEIRDLCKSLTPPTLKDIGLAEAIQELIDSYEAAGQFVIHYVCKYDLDELEEDLQFSIYRIMQEQLQNITKHADAKNVWISMDNKGSKINIQVRDDGIGFNKKAKAEGVGFANIINRLELYNGTMEIITAPQNGCYINIIIPVNNGKIPVLN